ncbi:acetyl-CoA carboxylase biotin carboxylase subunit [Mycolicibacterium agri]|uniref:biotin carboxylase n=1 Tax=Mycolicibacterium agri TaxID=36811 RepID=A0A2A7NEP4_MYCAG|nr:acetyl-CoA carboxylase biotin carboxylase subunit [Mycolicibacterium agri]PEG41938.1 acetyl-CoA carboxylase biotin carboxylase subunit [Mycolicibacterium agri]GFG49931.1 acetyl-CoA carboxylase biotin carboxylase subunit [Mycolicibacterium agri]
MPRLKRVLIANRGEIAVRVLRAARDLGIETVAVYSTADRDARHVALADRAVHIGPPSASASYLRREALVHVAQASGCDSVHPGYGFLAEDADFARMVAAAGLTWVGPDPETITQMGDKARARALAARAGVPVVAGSDGILRDDDEAVQFGREHGYPLLLKASAGGGGKGMRVVHGEEELMPALALARQEASGAFGDDGMYVERYLSSVRHVEVQVMADHHGGVVSLGERDCSVQRRHQKLVEEAPAPCLTDSVRNNLSETAVRLAAAANYRGAGTVEYLLDTATGDFAFIEMNTRIQVEHPVTEEITGVDLVAWQLRVAGGERLDGIDSPVARGHAMEFRITAEDPTADFRPSPGRIARFDPPSGPGIRCDTHCYSGWTVSPYYDSLIAKLVVHGTDRDESIRRARRALDEFEIDGVATTLPFHRWLLDQPEFIDGTHTTSYLAERLARTHIQQEAMT